MTRVLSQRLTATVDRAATALGEIDEATATRAAAPGKWSPKEVIGHLIDSAVVNHQRFAQAGAPGDLEFGTYDQELFVQLQRPSDVAWSELVELWRLLNRHVARVIDASSDETLARLLPEQDLASLAWKLPAEGEPATLEYFMRDYLGHLLHHLGQISPGLGSEAPAAGD